MKKRELRVSGIKKVIVGVLAVVILCGGWIANAFAYNIITTAPTYTQHKAYRDARESKTPEIEDGKYVYTLQINIAEDRWEMDREIGGEDRKVDEQYVTEFIDRLNEIYVANDVKVKFKVDDIYLTSSEWEGKDYRKFYYAAPNDLVVELLPEKEGETHGRSYYSYSYSRIYVAPSYYETTGYSAQVLAHEMGHYRGMQDTYFNKVQVNEVNSELRRTSYDGLMCSNKTTFLKYEKALLNYYASQPVIGPPVAPYVADAYPATNYFQVLDDNGQPIPNAQVKVYNSEYYGAGPYAKIANTPSWEGTSNSSGKVLLTGKAQPGPLYDGYWPTTGGNRPPFKVQLIEIKANGQTKYVWMELEDYHCAYWNGNTSSYTWKVDFNKEEIINKLEAPADIFRPRPDGTLIKGSGTTVYLIENGKKRPFVSAEDFEGLGYKWENIVKIEDAELNHYPLGTSITPPPPPDQTYYTVQSGDSLSKIAAKLGVDWRELARVNGISSPYVIYVGQKLIIPGVTPPPPPPDQTYYTVQSGDSLSKIAAKLGVDWRELARVNGISSPYIIHVGQRLIIPGVTPPPPPPDVTYYTVQSGDYLSKIAAKLGVDWKELARVNGISSPYVIYVGQRLIIPGVSGAPITKIDPFKFGLLDQKVVPLEEHLEYAGTGERVKPGEAYEEATRALGEAKSLTTTGAEGSTVEAIKKLEEETLKYHMGGKAGK